MIVNSISQSPVVAFTYSLYYTFSFSLRDLFFFFFSSRRRHTRLQGDWSSDVCSSDLFPRSTASRRCCSSPCSNARRAHSSRGKSNIFLMQSSGGITALTSAAREPVRTVLSGPAGGVVGAAAMARHSGFERIISFDMGGTSTDVALVDREIRTGSQAEIAGFPVGVPMLDIHTVGAGGGSIARFDAAGALRVGPESAGADPRDFTLVAFGGAGGLHACELAEALGIPRVIVPALPGALSAFGILVSDVVKDYSRTVLWRIAGKLPAELFEREFAILRRNAEKSFREEGWRGAINFRRSVDVRYRGQGYELNVPHSNTLAEDFRREHQRRYGYSYDRELELVTLRLRAKIRTSQAKISPRSARKAQAAQKQKRKKAPVLFEGKKFDTSVYDRDVIPIGKRYSGPAVVTEYSATTVVSPGRSFWLDRAGNLMIAVR